MLLPTPIFHVCNKFEIYFFLITSLAVNDLFENIECKFQKSNMISFCQDSRRLSRSLWTDSFQNLKKKLSIPRFVIGRLSLFKNWFVPLIIYPRRRFVATISFIASAKYLQWLTFTDSLDFSKDIMISSNLHMVSLLNSVIVGIILERTVDTIAIWAVGWFSKQPEELTVVSLDLRGGELEELKKFSASLWLWSFSTSVFCLFLFWGVSRFVSTLIIDYHNEINKCNLVLAD